VGVVGAGVVGAGVVGVGAAGAHVNLTIVSLSSVTAPSRASTRPSTVTPVVTVMLADARIVPMNLEPVLSVAELPICQKTLQDCALRC
jgi:3-hydroxyacyl-CoA dehydrogenase